MLIIMAPPNHRNHHHRSTATTRHHSATKIRMPFEEFEKDDLVVKSGTTTKTSYEILAETCSFNPSDLRKWAKILRLKPTCEVYKNINEYVQNSGSGGIKTKQIYKLTRNDEREPFNESYRIMLWHGTKPNCIPGIVQNGFKKGSGGCFGGGIYLADRLAKSQGYASSTPKGTTLYVLAEVSPGKVYKAHHAHGDYTTAPPGFDTVKGNGSSIPTWKHNKYYYRAILPCGVTTTNTRHSSYDLTYNEYIVYDSDRVIPRFIVECGV